MSGHAGALCPDRLIFRMLLPPRERRVALIDIALYTA
jgi:hypothetical protein